MCFIVIVPATCEPAFPAPVSIPAARFSSNDVGGANNAKREQCESQHGIKMSSHGSFDEHSSLCAKKKELTLDIECESAVRVDGNDGWSGESYFEMSSSCVELFGKVHSFDTLGTKRRTNRRLCGSLTGGDDKLDERCGCSYGCLSSLLRHGDAVPFLRLGDDK